MPGNYPESEEPQPCKQSLLGLRSMQFSNQTDHNERHAYKNNYYGPPYVADRSHA